MQGRNVVTLHPKKTVDQERIRLFNMFYLSMAAKNQKDRLAMALDWRNQMDSHFIEYRKHYLFAR